MNKTSPNNTGAGKGDKPRNCFSKKFKDNYDEIDWTAHKKINEKVSDRESVVILKESKIIK